MRSAPIAAGTLARGGRLSWRGAGAVVVATALAIVVVIRWQREAAVVALAGSRPTIVLISIDTLRADHLGCYGYDRATSPNIDALARSGVLFETALSPTSWTLPAHASLLTGVSPLRHGAVDARTRIAADVPLLAELLRRHGYVTEALVNAPFVAARYGFARGFDRFRYRPPGKRKVQRRHHDDVLQALRGALASDKPTFLFLHYMDVHSPYRPPPEFDRFASATAPETARRHVEALRGLQRALRDGQTRLAADEVADLIGLYDGEILAMDAKIGELVALIRGSGAPTVVVVTSDHGEEFLEHGGILHGTTLYEEVLRVPLIVSGRGIAAGQRVRRPVSLLDVAPTILEIAGVEAPGEIDGRSFAAEASGSATAPTEAYRLLLHTGSHNGKLDVRGVRTTTRKRIHDRSRERSELYDLAADPLERENLAGLEPTPELDAEIEAQALQRGDRLPRPDKRVRESLEALGYL